MSSTKKSSKTKSAPAGDDGEIGRMQVRFPEEPDLSRFVFDPIRKSVFGKDKAKITSVTSSAYYRNDEGKKCILDIVTPSQNVYVNYQYPMNAKETPSNIKGLQISYPITSKDTIKSPTKEEAWFKGWMDAIREATHKFSVKEGKKAQEKINKEEETALPENVADAFASNKPIGKTVKPLYAHPSKDPSKPLTMYVPLETSGKGLAMKTNVAFYQGEDDEVVNPISVLSRPINMEGLFTLKHIYYGAHGDTSFVSSVKLLLTQANISPGVGGGSKVPNEKLLPKNTSTIKFSAADLAKPPPKKNKKGSDDDDASNDGEDRTEEAEDFEKGEGKKKPKKSKKPAEPSSGSDDSDSADLPVKPVKAPKKKVPVVASDDEENPDASGDADSDKDGGDESDASASDADPPPPSKKAPANKKVAKK